jgi:hypothetical protein
MEQTQYNCCPEAYLVRNLSAQPLTPSHARMPNPNPIFIMPLLEEQTSGDIMNRSHDPNDRRPALHGRSSCPQPHAVPYPTQDVAFGSLSTTSPAKK